MTPEHGVSDIVVQDTTRPKHQKQAERFFASPEFFKQATRLYGNLSVPIRIVPIWGSPSLGSPGARVGSYDPETAGASLEDLGLPSPLTSELSHFLSSGGTIFCPYAFRMEKGLLPTPWMFVHAIFDSPIGNVRGANQVAEIFERVTSLMHDLKVAAMDGLGSLMELAPDFSKSFTFKSARTGALPHDEFGRDTVAEIMTQAILDSRGFRFVHSELGRFDAVLAEIEKAVSGARTAFESFVRGKMICVLVVD